MFDLHGAVLDRQRYTRINRCPAVNTPNGKRSGRIRTMKTSSGAAPTAPVALFLISPSNTLRDLQIGRFFL